ncbi:MAG: SH3 domain-containing protein [Pseudomonadota bacterium]
MPVTTAFGRIGLVYLSVFAVLWAGALGLAPKAAANDARAGAEIGPVTKLPIPRYVSLRSSEINVRRGPGLDYRKDWVFRRAGLPVRVVDEYGDWRQIVDKDEAGGWVYHAMITGRRTVLVVEDGVLLREEATDSAEATASAEQGVVARLRQCAPDWCEIEADGYRGWVRKAAIWGVDPTEEYDR